jgi:DNA-3-methyladenine glycosylase II
MKTQLQAHFETIDPVICGIVSAAEAYNLDKSSHESAFEALASSIASQQISGLVARKILERLMALFGGRFPTPAELAAATPESLRAVGFSFAKVAALQDLAAHCVDGRLPPDDELRLLDDEAIIKRCVAVRGIGRWTVQMLLMFHFSRHDVMPADDFGVRNGFRLAYGLKGLPKPKALLAYAERWKPYRSAGAWYLWRAVDLHQLGTLPKRVGRAPRIEIEVPKAPRQAGSKASKAKVASKKAKPGKNKGKVTKRAKPGARKKSIRKPARPGAALSKGRRAPRR